MKTILIVARENLITGNIKCGMAELISSLSTALAENYNVLVLTPDGHGLLPKVLFNTEDHGDYQEGLFLKVKYYLYRSEEAKMRLLNSLQYDIFHNFDEPDLINKLTTTPEKTVYTFETLEVPESEYLPLYDYVTTISTAHKFTILRRRSSLAQDLMNSNFIAVPTGISSKILNPESGLLLTQPFGPSSQEGKQINKHYICQHYNIPEDKPLFLMVCRMIKEKGIEYVLEALPYIKEHGGFVLIIGRGDRYYKDLLQKYTREDGLLWLDTPAKVTHLPSLLGGADFYLSPSLYESCGIMPLNACRYGTIPITTLNGGLGDNLNEENAIVIYDDIEPALQQAFELYNNPLELAAKRKACMEWDFSWDTRKKGYMDLYDA